MKVGKVIISVSSCFEGRFWWFCKEGKRGLLDVLVGVGFLFNWVVIYYGRDVYNLGDIYCKILVELKFYFWKLCIILSVIKLWFIFLYCRIYIFNIRMKYWKEVLKND